MRALCVILLAVAWPAGPVKTEPTRAPPREVYIHAWAVPEFRAIVWTWGQEVDWHPGYAKFHEWDPPDAPRRVEMVCGRCGKVAWCCPDGERIWPKKWEWPRPFGGEWYETWCQDAVWLGQIRERDWERGLLRRALRDN